MPKLSIEEKVNKVRDELIDKIDKESNSLREDLVYYKENFKLDEEAETAADRLIELLK